MYKEHEISLNLIEALPSCMNLLNIAMFFRCKRCVAGDLSGFTSIYISFEAFRISFNTANLWVTFRWIAPCLLVHSKLILHFISFSIVSEEKTVVCQRNITYKCHLSNLVCLGSLEMELSRVWVFENERVKETAIILYKKYITKCNIIFTINIVFY